METDAVHFYSEPTQYTTVFRTIFFFMSSVIAFILISNMCILLNIIKTLVISHQRRITNSFMKIGSPKEETCPSSLKNEVDTIVQMVSVHYLMT